MAFGAVLEKPFLTTAADGQVLNLKTGVTPPTLAPLVREVTPSVLNISVHGRIRDEQSDHDQGRSAPVCPGGSRLCSLGEPDGNIQSRYTVNNAAIITGPTNKPMRPKAVRPPKIPTDA